MPRKKSTPTPFLTLLIAYAIQAPLAELRLALSTATTIADTRGFSPAPAATSRPSRARVSRPASQPPPAAPPVRPPTTADQTDLAAARERANQATGVGSGRVSRPRAPRPPVAAAPPPASPLPPQGVE